MSQMEAPSQVQPEELRPADGFMDDSAEKPWEALIADASTSAKVQQSPPREAPGQREQKP